jgi:hypothetical protein
VIFLGCYFVLKIEVGDKILETVAVQKHHQLHNIQRFEIKEKKGNFLSIKF